MSSSVQATVQAGPDRGCGAVRGPGKPSWAWTSSVRAALQATALAAAACGIALSLPSAQARDTVRESRQAAGPVVSLQALPPQARDTWALVHAGGPFPYRKDGTVFGNRERLLPLHPRGFYREYTVRTPGSPDRGARRIVCGGLPPTAPEACYYTADHYASFARIVQ